MGMGMIIDLLEVGELLALSAPTGGFYYAQRSPGKNPVWDYVTQGEASTAEDQKRNWIDAVVVLLKSPDQKFIGFRSHVADGKVLQATKDKGIILRFSNQNFDWWEQWAVYGETLDNCLLVNRKFPDKRFHVAFHKVVTMTESSSEALKEQLYRAQIDAVQAKSEREETAKRILELESQVATNDKDVQIDMLQSQVEELREKLKKVEEASTCPTLSTIDPEAGSPKTQSEDEYIVVEQERTDILQSKLNEKVQEIEEATAHAKKFEELFKAAEEKTSKFEKQVQELEASICEKVNDANALLDKVKTLEELLTAGQIQIDTQQSRIAALEEKSKSNEEAQKKVEYEKVLFLETEDQLVKNFKKAHDEAEQHRNMIFQLEMSLKIAKEKAAHHESCADTSSQRNLELEAELAGLNSRIQSLTRDQSYDTSSVNIDTQLMELEKALEVYRDKADSCESKVGQLEQELQVCRGRESKLEEDLKSFKEKTAFHESHSNQLVEELEKLQEIQGSKSVLEAHATSLERKVSNLEQELGISRGSGNTLEEEMKSLEQNVAVHAMQSNLLVSELAELQSVHITYVCEAEAGNMQLGAHAKDLEEKVRQLEQELEVSRGRGEKLEEEVKSMEEKASAHEVKSNHWISEFDNLQVVHAEHLRVTEEKFSHFIAQAHELKFKVTLLEEHLKASKQREKDLEGDLNSMREQAANHDDEKNSWARESEKLCDFERRATSLQSLADDLKAKVELLEQELQISQGKEVKLNEDLKAAAEQAAAVELNVKSLMSELETLRAVHETHMHTAEASYTHLGERVKDLELKVTQLEQELEASQGREEKLKEEVTSMEEKAAAHSLLEQEFQTSRGRELKLNEDLKLTAEHAAAHELNVKSLILQLESSRAVHETHMHTAAASYSHLEEHAKDLELKVAQLEQELEASQGREQKLKEDLMSMEEKADAHSRVEQELQASQGRELKLGEDLKSAAVQAAAHELDVNSLVSELESLRTVHEVHTHDAKTSYHQAEERMKDLELNVTQLEQDLESSQGREQKLKEDMMSMEEKCAAHSQVEQELQASQGRELKLCEDLKAASEQAAAHEMNVNSLYAELEALRTVHEAHTHDAKTSYTRAEERMKDLESKVTQLEQQLGASQGREQSLTEDLMLMEEKAAAHSLLEQELQSSQGRELKLNEDLKSVAAQSAAQEVNFDSLALELESLRTVHEAHTHDAKTSYTRAEERMKDLESKVAQQEQQLEASQEREQELEEDLMSMEEKCAAHSRVEQELQASQGRELKLKEDLKSAAEQAAAYELNVNSLVSELESLRTVHEAHTHDAKASYSLAEEHSKDLELKVNTLEHELEASQGREQKLKEGLMSMEEKADAHSLLEQEFQTSQGRVVKLSEDLKLAAEQAAAHEVKVDSLVSELETLRTLHETHTHSAQTSYSYLEEHATDLEYKVTQLEQELEASQGREQKLKEDLMLMEEKEAAHSLLEQEFETSQGREAKLNENLKSAVEQAAAQEFNFNSLVSELQSLRTVHEAHMHDSKTSYTHAEERTKDLELKGAKLEQELEASQGREQKLKEDLISMEEKYAALSGVDESEITSDVGDLSTHLEAHVDDLMFKVAELEHELQTSKGREENLHNDLKCMEEKSAAHSLLEERGKDLELKVTQLEQELEASQGREQKLKEDLMSMEEKSAAHSQVEQGLQASQGREVKLNEDLQLAGEQAAAQELHVNCLVSELETLRTAHDVCTHNAEATYAHLEEHAKDLELKVTKLEQELEASQGREEKLKEDLASMSAAHSRVDESETTGDVGDMSMHLEAHVDDLVFKVGQLEQELQASKGREESLHNDLKCMEEKAAVHEQISSNWVKQSTKQVIDHDTQVQALETRIRGLEEELWQAKARIEDQSYWAQEATSVLRVHSEYLDELREIYSEMEHCLSTSKVLGNEERETLQAKANALHLELSDTRPCDLLEALQMYTQLLSFKREGLRSQMIDMAHTNARLVTQVEVLNAQLQEKQISLESAMKEQKKSFREAILDGELQSLRAQSSENSSLHLRLTQMQQSLRASEARELQQNLDLAREQQRVAAAEGQICSLKDMLANQVSQGPGELHGAIADRELASDLQAQVSQLWEQITVLENKVSTAKSEKAALSKEIDILIRTKTSLGNNVNDVILLEQASELNHWTDDSTRRSKSSQRKARKRKTGKTAKAAVSEEAVQATVRTNHSTRDRLTLYLLAVVLVAMAIRFGLG